MKKNNIAAIILSAGYSSRMGDFKPLLKFGEYTAVEMIVNTFISSGINNIITVVGHRGVEVSEVLKISGVECVENKNYSKGMYSSVIKALEFLDDNTDAFFILPVDIPLIKKYTVETLKKQYLEYNKGIIYPTFNGIKGHPPLIDCKYKDIIMKGNKNGGLKRVLNKFYDDSINIPVFDKSTIMDMDTREDYLKLLEYLNLGAPSREECYSIFDIYDVPNNIIEHSVKVSSVALNILKELNRRGYNFSKGIIEAAALLHDISRRSKDHAKVGGELLTKFGYEHIGKIIATHMDIEVDEETDINENEILYLADKLVEEGKLVPLEYRFSDYSSKYNNNYEALIKIKKRYTEAKKVMAKIENIIGKSFNYE